MRVLYLSLIIIVIDQLTKLLVKGFSIPFLDLNLKGLYPGQKINLIGQWFNITFVENPGIAFGIDFGGDYKLLISLFTIAATAGLFIYLYFIRKENFEMRLSVAFILGGAVGNLIDRVFYGVLYGYAPLLYGKVVDFIDIRVMNFFIFDRTAGNYIINFADLAVTSGVILLLFSYTRQRKQSLMMKESSENILAENKE